MMDGSPINPVLDYTEKPRLGDMFCDPYYEGYLNYFYCVNDLTQSHYLGQRSRYVGVSYVLFREGWYNAISDHYSRDRKKKKKLRRGSNHDPRR